MLEETSEPAPLDAVAPLEGWSPARAGDQPVQGRRSPVLQPAVRRAYDGTKAAIAEGELPPGEWVTEGQVAAALGVSRTPVREAFLRLEAEGLLRLFPRRGAMVVELTDRDVAEVLELWELLESFAAWQAAEVPQHLQRALANRLRALVEDQRQAWVRNDAVGVARSDRDFHAAIVHSAGSRLMDEVYAMLRDRQERLAVDSFRRWPDRFPTALAEHSRLVDLLERGDVGGYELTLRRHLSGTRQALASS